MWGRTGTSPTLVFILIPHTTLTFEPRACLSHCSVLAHKLTSGMSPLPRQHPRLTNTDLPGCIVRQDFHCAVLSDALGQQGVEQCLSFHPNGLAVVQLSPTHPAVGDGDRRGKLLSSSIRRWPGACM